MPSRYTDVAQKPPAGHAANDGMSATSATEASAPAIAGVALLVALAVPALGYRPDYNAQTTVR